jgi:hypothetical protein
MRLGRLWYISHARIIFTNAANDGNPVIRGIPPKPEILRVTGFIYDLHPNQKIFGLMYSVLQIIYYF